MPFDSHVYVLRFRPIQPVGARGEGCCPLSADSTSVGGGGGGVSAFGRFNQWGGGGLLSAFRQFSQWGGAHVCKQGGAMHILKQDLNILLLFLLIG